MVVTYLGAEETHIIFENTHSTIITTVPPADGEDVDTVRYWISDKLLYSDGISSIPGVVGPGAILTTSPAGEPIALSTAPAIASPPVTGGLSNTATFPSMTTSDVEQTSLSVPTLPAVSVSSSAVSDSSASATTATPVSSDQIAGAARNNGVLSAGATAGVAIACFLGGALLAALALLCLTRMRKRRQSHDYAPAAVYDVKDHSATDSVPAVVPKGAASTTAAAATPPDFPPESTAAVVEAVLPPPTDDEAVRTAFMGLRTQINNHVLSFYRTNPSQETVPLPAIAATLPTAPFPPETLQALLKNHKSRSAALRFVISWVALSRCGTTGDPAASFLPEGLVAFLRTVPQSDQPDTARTAVLSKWRQITAYLTGPPPTAASTLTLPDPQARGVGPAADAADSAVRLYGKGDGGERLENLEEVMRRAARLALVLFAHPSEWRFDWGAGARTSGQAMTAFPSLIQTTDVNGRPYARGLDFGGRDSVRI